MEKNVYDETLERIEYCLDSSDTFVVCFSGGKDSTALLNCALEVAEAKKRLPLEVFFGDEEGIGPDTVDYCRRVAQDERINMTWSCIPLHNRNACSRNSPFWYSWDPREKDKWCRDLPPEGITTEMRPDIPWGNIPEQIPYWYGLDRGTVIQALGRRAQESLTRWRFIAARGGKKAFISKANSGGAKADDGKSFKFKNIFTADPIYDWRVEDVWTAPFIYGWDYNRIYDKYSRLGIKPSDQRIGPPFHEEGLNSLWTFPVMYPELWDRMQTRVPGVNTATKFFRSQLYDKGGTGHIRPNDGESWQEYVYRLLHLWSPKYRVKVAENVQALIKHHDRVCVHFGGKTEPIPDIEKHEKSGVSWLLIAKMVRKGVFKGRALQMMAQGNIRVRFDNDGNQIDENGNIIAEISAEDMTEADRTMDIE